MCCARLDFTATCPAARRGPSARPGTSARQVRGLDCVYKQTWLTTNVPFHRVCIGAVCQSAMPHQHLLSHGQQRPTRMPRRHLQQPHAGFLCCERERERDRGRAGGMMMTDDDNKGYVGFVCVTSSFTEQESLGLSPLRLMSPALHILSFFFF